MVVFRTGMTWYKPVDINQLVFYSRRLSSTAVNISIGVFSLYKTKFAKALLEKICAPQMTSQRLNCWLCETQNFFLNTSRVRTGNPGKFFKFWPLGQKLAFLFWTPVQKRQAKAASSSGGNFSLIIGPKVCNIFCPPQVALWPPGLILDLFFQKLSPPRVSILQLHHLAYL